MSAVKSPLVLMMAGGTGGHVYPALAVARDLLDRGCRVEWVGTARGLESRVVPAAGITLHQLVVRGVRGKSLFSKLTGAAYLLFSSLQALWLVLRRSPDCVVGMGGYVAGPAGIAAWCLRKPLVIHEQNAVAGTTNRMLAPFARRVLCGFPGAFSADQDTVVVGNPVRRELLQRASVARYNYDGSQPLRVLVLGGSLGAKPINDLVPAAMAILRETEGAASFEVWHQAGEAHLKGVGENYGAMLGHGVKATAFIEDMASAYEWADLVICRAGALTVSELAIMGRPAVLIPLPHAIDDHQSANAHFLTDAGGGEFCVQKELSAEVLAQMLKGYMKAPERLAAMADISLKLGNPHATVAVCDRVQELIDDQ